MSKFKLPANVTRAFGKIGFQLKKHSPEILIVTGVVGTVASAVLACKASTKVNGVIDDAKEKLEAIKQCEEHQMALLEPYSKEDAKKDRLIVYATTAKDLGKLYGPALTLGAASIACIFASNNILRKRSAAIAAAYATIDNSFKDYRKRVVDRFGEELDKELRFNIKPKEVEEVVVDENGKETTVTKTVYTAETGVSDYARFFDATCPGWTKNPEFNLMFLKRQQDQANEVLQAKGFIFLNEVYEMIGIMPTQAGQQVGWWYDPKNPEIDSYVDLGIYSKSGLHNNREFVNGIEAVCLIEPNVDGNILYHFEK